MQPTPEDGDIVVRHETRGTTRVYVLHIARRSDQILHRTREGAVAQAVAFAKQHHVGAWIATEDGDRTLLGDFRRPERNDVTHRTLQRLQGEFLEMPGLRLTIQQAERLCGIESTMCKAILDALVDVKFLHVRPDGSYIRVTEGAAPQIRSAAVTRSHRLKPA
jgi:hypothetical protein